MELANIDTILFDLNGTLYQRRMAIPGVNQTLSRLREAGLHLTFITNTDGRSVGAVHQAVVKMGLGLDLEEVYTPVSAVKAFFAQNQGKSFYPLVHDDVLPDLQGMDMTDRNPDYVVIGDFCDKVSYGGINKVFRMLKAGAEIIALSKTLWYIDVDGYSINTGAFVSMFERACEKEALLMGKPSRDFFAMALSRTKSDAAKTLVVGDGIDVDVLGARQIGATSALVKTGVFDVAKLEKSAFAPDYVIENVNALPNLLGLVK